MKTELKVGPSAPIKTLVFKDLDNGDWFLDKDGDLCFKDDFGESGNAFCIASYSTPVIYFVDENAKVTRVSKLNITYE